MDEYGLTQEQVAQQMGKSRPAIANTLRLLALPDEVLALLEEGILSAGHARAILGAPTAAIQKEAAPAGSGGSALCAPDRSAGQGSSKGA